MALRWLVCLAILTISATAAAERLPIRTYTVADGLAHNIVNRIVRDERGFLWFCTAEGLSLFDGYRFTNYDTTDGLPHQHVADVLATREGVRWIATYGGLVRFNPHGTRGGAGAGRLFTVVTPATEDRRRRAMTRLIQLRDETILAGTMDGVVQVRRTGSEDTLVPVDFAIDPPPAGVEALHEDRFGTLWIGADNGLYRRWPDGRVVRYTKRDGFPDDYIHDLHEDRDGRLWVATRLGGFFALAIDAQPAAAVVQHLHNSANGFVDWIFDLSETSDGRFFAATNHGVLEFPSTRDTASAHAQLHLTDSGLAYHEVTSVAEDRDQNVWLGSINGGMKIARGGFRTFDRQDGVHLVNSLFAAAGGELSAFGYVAARGREAHVARVGQFDGRRFTWLSPRLPGPPSWSPRLFVLQAQSREWWIGTVNGLARFPPVQAFHDLDGLQPSAVYTVKHGLATNTVYTVYEDSRGDVWVSTIADPGAANGLARWDRGTGRVRDLASLPGLPSLVGHLAVSFQEDRDGGIWIGFSPGGLGRVVNERFAWFTEAEGLAAGAVNDLFVDQKGRLWAATTRGGVSRLDDPSAPRPVFRNYSTAEGLSSNRVNAITGDEQGRIYAGTGRGLDQIAPDSGRIRHFTTADGLAAGDSMAAFRDRRGTIWFSARQGLSRFTPGPEQIAEPPPIAISGLRIAGEPWIVSALGDPLVRLPSLGPDRNQLQIDFVGVSFAPGENLRYQYKLDEAAADWSVPTDQRTVHLVGLAPGDYTFRVRALSADRVPSPQPAIVTFTVLPPVWRRAWFLAVCGLLTAGLLYALYRHRLSQFLEVERVRTRIASDLHDDIGAALSRIAVLSEVAGQEAGDANPVVTSRLSAIAGASREVLDAMSDIVWAISPQRDQIRDLTQRMRRFASDMFSARHISFSFRAPQDDQRLTLGADVRRHVLLIFKEAVNNVLRHSGCTRADLELRVQGGRLALIVSDNGQGFDPAGAFEGNGLGSMRARARMMGGDLRIDSNQEGGTMITLTVDPRAQVNESSRRRSPSA